MSKHLKRLFAPKSWKVKRKGIKYISKPSAGPHKRDVSLPLNVILRDILDYAKNNRDVKYILEAKDVTIDGIKRKDYRFPLGLFDVLSFKDLDEHYRVILDKKGNVHVIMIDKKESNVKLCKINGKTIVKGKIQLNLHDGKNILVDDKKYKVGDVLLFSFGKKSEIKDLVTLDKGSIIFLIGGKHKGQLGNVQDISGNKILYKTESGDIVETLKRDVFPVGKEKPLIKLTE